MVIWLTPPLNCTRGLWMSPKAKLLGKNCRYIQSKCVIWSPWSKARWHQTKTIGMANQFCFSGCLFTGLLSWGRIDWFLSTTFIKLYFLWIFHYTFSFAWYVYRIFRKQLLRTEYPEPSLYPRRGSGKGRLLKREAFLCPWLLMRQYSTKNLIGHKQRNVSNFKIHYFAS